MTWLAIFGAFLGGVAKGWIGETPKKPVKLDPLVRKDREAEINKR
jgi:hypothetical protein